MEEILKELQTMESGTCVSIIVPAYKSKPDSLQNHIILENAMKQAEETIANSQYAGELVSIKKKLQDLHHQINFQETGQGLGLFISAKTARLVHFTFPVKEKVIVGSNFEVRDLIYAINHETNYWLLSLSMNKSRLYRGKSEELTEISDEVFPFAFEDQYEHQKASEPYDADKSSTVEIREKQYFRKIDKLLYDYLKKERQPVLIAGVDKYIGYYLEITRHKNAIIGDIRGNFDKMPLEKIASSAWEEMKKNVEKEKEDTLKKLDEAIGNHQCVWGIEDVWQETANGNADTLIVEKDFIVPGVVSNALFSVHLDGGKEEMQKKLNDAVDDIIEMVWNQKGRVVFVGNGKLKNYDRIALLLRY